MRHRLSSTRRDFWMTVILLAGLGVAVHPQHACALIEGGEGNQPIDDPGWPRGAAAIFNHRARTAFWVGPPLGGGQWHAECRGVTSQFNEALADFANLDVKTKRLVVHDGIGNSFWLNPNRLSEGKEKAKIDWVFTVWQSESWEQLRTLPADFNPTNPKDAELGPPSQIDVYVGFNIRWDDVVVPIGIEIIDQRLEAHGYALTDGNVIEGTIKPGAGGETIRAQVEMELVELQPGGGYRYTTVQKIQADEEAHWVFKNAPEGWHRIVARAEGYVPRIVTYLRSDDQPSWESYETTLSRAVPVSGRVTDDHQQPLADVEVRLVNVATASNESYASAEEYITTTDANGQFRFDGAPAGAASVSLIKSGYYQPNARRPIQTPAEDLSLKLSKAADVHIVVGFTKAQRPDEYIVNMVPEGGEAVGKWSGSSMISDQDEVHFRNVPPGRYVIVGQPNPGSENQRTEPQLIVLKGGETIEVKVLAK